ncbi:MAG: glycosyltransferase [Gemmataceae bacterium]|nr:glycosyltransferase [Gemmataceae bacterium]
MPKIVLVHDWLTGMRGGEKCLERLANLFPDAPIATLFHDAGSVSAAIERHPILTSFLQSLPGRRSFYRYLLPTFPAAANWRLPACDAVISLSHCVAKGAVAPAGTPHLCYCFTPMRYAWHMQDQYFAPSRSPVAWARNKVLGRLRDWDCRTSDRVSHFIAISKTVQDRIRECYDRESTIIYPPVDIDFYCPSAKPRDDFYLIVSALVPYKRLDIAVEACRRLDRRLVVIGTGPETSRLKPLAGPKTEFRGWNTDEEIRNCYQSCRALLFPGEEDFGIVPVEAQACGAPVIAYDRGGATETVRPDTGVLFSDQTVDGMIAAIEQFESRSAIRPVDCRRNAERFDYRRFDAQIAVYLSKILGQNVRRAA